MGSMIVPNVTCIDVTELLKENIVQNEDMSNNGWFPISTAPKDGTEIDICVEYFKSDPPYIARIVRCRWDDEFGFYWTLNYPGCDIWYKVECDVRRAIFWKPIIFPCITGYSIHV